MSAEREPTATDYFLLCLLALFWGSAFLFVEIALRAHGPLTTAGFRVGLGALILLVVAVASGNFRMLSPRDLGYLTLCGLAGTALPFGLIAWAQQDVASSTASILIAFTPIATMLLAQVMTADERITRRRLMGCIIALSGVAFLVGGPGVADSRFRMAAVLLGAFCYAISSLWFRRVEHLPAATSAGSAILISAIIMVPIALIMENPFDDVIMVGPFLALVALGVFPTALATILMVSLLNRTSATFISFNSFLIPVTGTLMGVFILGENFRASQSIGLLLILSGLLLARRKKAKRRGQIHPVP